MSYIRLIYVMCPLGLFHKFFAKVLQPFYLVIITFITSHKEVKTGTQTQMIKKSRKKKKR